MLVSSSGASQLYEIEDLIFAAYVRNLLSTRYYFHYHSTNLNIHTIGVYCNPVKVPSLSEWTSVFFSSMIDSDQENLVDQTWVKFTSLFSNASIFSRSIVDNHQDNLTDQSKSSSLDYP